MAEILRDTGGKPSLTYKKLELVDDANLREALYSTYEVITDQIKALQSEGLPVALFDLESGDSFASLWNSSGIRAFVEYASVTFLPDTESCKNQDVCARIIDDISLVSDFLSKLDVTPEEFANRSESSYLIVCSILEKCKSIQEDVRVISQELYSFRPKKSEVTVECAVNNLTNVVEAPKVVQQEVPKNANSLQRSLSRALNLPDEQDSNLEEGAKDISFSRVPRLFPLVFSTKETGVASETSVVNDKTNGELELSLSFSESFVPVSLDGQSLGIDQWFEAACQIDPSLKELSLLKSFTVPFCKKFKMPNNGQADLLVALDGSGSKKIKIPYGFTVVGAQFKSSWGFRFRGNVEFKRNFVGIHYVDVPKGAKSLELRVEKQSNEELISEELYCALLRSTTSFSMETKKLVAEQIEKASQLDLSLLIPKEREDLVMDIAHAFKLQSPVYSQSVQLKEIVDATQGQYTNFLNGINTGTCATLSWQVCMQLRAAGFPAFLVGGDVLKGMKYETDPGHMQVLVLTPKPIILDPTIWTKRDVVFDVASLRSSKLEIIKSRVSSEAAFSVGTELYNDCIVSRDRSKDGHKLRDQLSKSPSEELQHADWEMRVFILLKKIVEQCEEKQNLDDLLMCILRSNENLECFSNNDTKTKLAMRDEKPISVSYKVGEQIFEITKSLLTSKHYPAMQRTQVAFELAKRISLNLYAREPGRFSDFFSAALEPEICATAKNSFVRFPRLIAKEAKLDENNREVLFSAYRTYADAALATFPYVDSTRKAEITTSVVMGLFRVYHEFYRDSRLRQGDALAKDACEHISSQLQKLLKGSDVPLAPIFIKILEIDSSISAREMKDFFNDVGCHTEYQELLQEENKALLALEIVKRDSLTKVVELVCGVENHLQAQLDLLSHQNELEAKFKVFSEENSFYDFFPPVEENPYSRWIFCDENRCRREDAKVVVALHRRGGLSLDAVLGALDNSGLDIDSFGSFVEMLGDIRSTDEGELELRDRNRGVGSEVVIDSGLLIMAALSPEIFKKNRDGQTIIYIAKKLEELGYFNSINDYKYLKAWKENYPNYFVNLVTRVSSRVNLDDYEMEGVLKCISDAVPKFRDAAYLHSVAVSENFLLSEKSSSYKAAQGKFGELTNVADSKLAAGDFDGFEQVVAKMSANASHSNILNSKLAGLYYLYDRKQQNTFRLYSVYSSASTRYWRNVETPPYKLPLGASSLEEVWYRVLMDMHYFRTFEFSKEEIIQSIKRAHVTLNTGRRRSSNFYLSEVEGGNIKTASRTDNFLGYRAYTPGDDLRLIDYSVLARLDKYYIKQFGVKPPTEEGVENVVMLLDGDACLSNPRKPHSQVIQAVQYSIIAEHENKKLEANSFFRGAEIWKGGAKELQSSSEPAGFSLMKQLWTTGYDVGVSYCQAWGRTHPLTPLFNKLPSSIERALSGNDTKGTLFVFACSPSVLAVTLEKFPELNELSIAHMKGFSTVKLDEVIDA